MNDNSLHTVGILIFDDVEVLDFCGPFEVFSVARPVDRHRATTHWNSVEWMRTTYPAITMLDDQRVVDEGHIITSAGVSAGIDMSLHMVARLHGMDTVRWTARRMEYEKQS
jgi:hypothetical protein